ncbi:MAG: glycoside hydrolase family 9 protein, partial [Panacagrimonas sp.]
MLRTALRVFFYQRSGCEKARPFADACWTDTPAYLGKLQDTEARDYRHPHDASTARDLGGGWFDAGDTNKYVTFSSAAVHSLLTAFSRAPDAFDDDAGIPESGNGIPDLLDEVRWQLAWLKKMQNKDGTALLKVGVTRHVPASPPSRDREPRYYVGPCSSATIAAAAMFAHAAAVLKPMPEMKKETRDLRRRAARGFDAFTENARRDTHCDEQKVLSGDADVDAPTQDALAVVAAIYLFAVTDEPRFNVYVKAHYRGLR